MDKAIVVAIDGPAGAGKSTIAKCLARRLGFSYLDTGAMYRSLTLKALQTGVNLEDEPALEAMSRQTSIDLQGDPVNGVRVILDGRDVSQEIRTPEVTNQTCYIARAPRVRAVMVGLQQDIGSRHNVVIEGRDIGTVVFPDAAYKFYLDATVEERAQRRYKEFLEKGKEISLEQVIADVRRRDESDFSRTVGPLKKADDAIVIDSTALTIEQVVETMAGYMDDGWLRGPIQ